MSLTGLFLCLFLVVHMIGNLQLFVNDNGETFNQYAYFMTHNGLIKFVSYGNYFFILLHAVQGILITAYNKKAKGGRYQGKEVSDTEASFAARNMRNLGLLIFAFIGIHLWNFWAKMHFFEMPTATYDGETVKDLYILVSEAFKNPALVLFYLVSLVALAIHLWHGFWSAFQSLGLNNQKYSPILRGAALGYSILIPLGFATMPIWFYVKQFM